MSPINRATRVLHAIETRTWERDLDTTVYWLTINLGDTETSIRRAVRRLLDGGFIVRATKVGREYGYRAIRKDELS